LGFLGTVEDTLIIQVLLNAGVALLVKSFYSRRIWLLGKNYIQTAAVFILVLGELVVSIVYCVKAFDVKVFSRVAIIQGWAITINAVGASGDIAIAAFLCFILQNRKTGFQSTDSTLTKLMAFVVNTGLLTSLCAVCSFIAVVVRPDSLLNVLFYFCLGKLYSNSFLATLNAREAIQFGSHDESFALNKFGGTSHTGTRQNLHPEIGVKVTQTYEYDKGASSYGENHINVFDVKPRPSDRGRSSPM